MLWATFTNNTIITYNEEEKAGTTYKFLTPVQSLSYNEKEYGKDSILNLNVRAYRPIVFIKPNIVKTYYIRYAPFRLR